uniref:Bestrophin homolog n=1 Tax=Mesocestoides corti TaxID=53468 RepID=A0A5K3EEW8_MESCO
MTSTFSWILKIASHLTKSMTCGWRSTRSLLMQKMFCCSYATIQVLHRKYEPLLSGAQTRPPKRRLGGPWYLWFISCASATTLVSIWRDYSSECSPAFSVESGGIRFVLLYLNFMARGLHLLFDFVIFGFGLL